MFPDFWGALQKAVVASDLERYNRKRAGLQVILPAIIKHNYLST
jgi:hypothetical protein